ncbi:MAG: tetratricopeptide repeat protein [Aulosira sp. DedQUE10]|nr:tetratricopeptide repeat protein [Aulosira sp. DedQUE10]
MANSGEDYLIKRSKQIKRKQNLLTIVFLVSFVSSTVFSGVSLIKHAIQTSKTVVPSPESSLQKQEKGFEMVLQREPENLVALEGLVNVRIELKDTQGAIQALEKLVKLSPERQDYKDVLEQLKKEQGKSNSLTNNGSKSHE